MTLIQLIHEHPILTGYMGVLLVALVLGLNAIWSDTITAKYRYRNKQDD